MPASELDDLSVPTIRSTGETQRLVVTWQHPVTRKYLPRCLPNLRRSCLPFHLYPKRGLCRGFSAIARF